MNYLKLTLSAVMQRYADASTALRQEYRTNTAPTKSAIIGLVGGALGVPRGSNRLKELNDALDVKYKVVKFGVISTDFQTINRLKFQDYYANQQNRKKYFTKVDGTLEKKVKRSQIKEIQYLQDTEFEIYLGSDSIELLREIHSAIKNPVYALYLGKRSCVPNKPIVTRDFLLLDEGELKNVYHCT